MCYCASGQFPSQEMFGFSKPSAYVLDGYDGSSCPSYNFHS